MDNTSALKDYAFQSKYARWNKKENRRETKSEAFKRMMSMHFHYLRPRVERSLEKHRVFTQLVWSIEDALNKEQILPSMRGMQNGGQAILDKHCRSYNCAGRLCDDLSFFPTAMYLLLCGNGIGFSMQKQHIAQLPPIRLPSEKERVFVIPDTIEGWADAVYELFLSYTDRASEGDVWFDYSQIRPKGALIASTGAQAPGPDKLRLSLEASRRILDKAAAERGRLKPIEAYDIMMHLADAVVSGGIRRSATICLFSPDDEEMLNAKRGDNYTQNPQRGRSNNSAVLLRGNDEYNEQWILQYMENMDWGEPGFVFVDDLDMVMNPCVEIGWYGKTAERPEDTRAILEDHEDWLVNKERLAEEPDPKDQLVSRWCFCNLTSINAETCEDEQDFSERAQLASALGTFQAAYTDFGYLNNFEEINVSERAAEYGALIGVSITGMARNPKLAFDPRVLQKGAEAVKKANEVTADLLGIRPAARTTCIKPEGTGSLTLGTSCGIHADYAKRYIRRSQGAITEHCFRAYKRDNPDAIEQKLGMDGQVSPDSGFVLHAIEAPEGTELRGEKNAVEQLQRVADVYENWVMPGKVAERCLQGQESHNVSNTITFDKSELELMARQIASRKRRYAGISFAETFLDEQYIQAPFTAVYTRNELIERFGLEAVVDTEFQLAEILEDENYNQNNSAYIYVFTQQNILLRHLYHWHLWRKLAIETGPVDYQKNGRADQIESFQEVACAGGACLI